MTEEPVAPDAPTTATLVLDPILVVGVDWRSRMLPVINGGTMLENMSRIPEEIAVPDIPLLWSGGGTRRLSANFGAGNF